VKRVAAKIPAGKKQGKEVIPPDSKKGGKYKGFSLTKKQVGEIAKKKFNVEPKAWGEIAEEAHASLQAHLDGCPACREDFESLMAYLSGPASS
jgi:hypothetical protein